MSKTSKLGNTFTTSALLETAQSRYPHMVVDGVVFRNYLWFEDDDRQRFKEIMPSGDDSDDDRSPHEFGHELLMLAAEDKKAAKVLLDSLGTQTAIWNVLIGEYMKRTQVGEA